jgi:hypothetical protein
VASFIVVEAMDRLAKCAAEDGEEDTAVDRSVENWLAFLENVCGAVAVLLQLALLAWVDLAAIPLDPILKRRWVFRCVRMSAHCIVFLIHLPFMLLRSPNRRFAGLVVSNMVLFVLLTCIQRFTFSQRYIVVSITVSLFSWLLYFFRVTKKHVLLCEPGDRGHRNVLAFDFFCRILIFSFFWYAALYNPTETFKPKWTDNLR